MTEEQPSVSLDDVARALQDLRQGQARLEAAVAAGLSVTALESLSSHYQRNQLPADDAALQKILVSLWRPSNGEVLSHADLAQSGFRVFSQNDEDGIVLRLFAQIGTTNRNVIEVGSNCAGSAIGIPENISTNLLVHHGWHGAIFELDPIECGRIQHFFAREHATRHFHWQRGGPDQYFSPRIIQQRITPQNINDVIQAAVPHASPDLMVIDIDSDDYAVVSALRAVEPRVLVVEFEKRFRHLHTVVQTAPDSFSRLWPQSGTCSLPAWEKLLGSRGYQLCAISSAGFNAFFVRSDQAAGKLTPITSEEAFDRHPVLSSLEHTFWLSPDPTWEAV